ncbi:NUDIX domain-containing protein [Peterkaempfera bronchialis]|uniref:NUDIX domain-containing protein n=1 Tax=Peterkaempfera bronchialis TaxID=2126346 RepID=A0A345SXV3_9ACTN|nr:NUDIX domain-containing protein [Peterkaempfera bronchialis]AXI78558.1 NUDIX domain-containing protein [Peterkaempfera bronchialis]
MSDLPSISVSVKAAIIHGGKVLLLSYDDSADGGCFHYNLPGGKAIEGESLRDAVVRKVRQETGLAVRTVRSMFVMEYVPGQFGKNLGPQHKTQHNFLAEITDGRTAPRFSDPRDPIQLGFEWVPLDQLTTKTLIPQVAPAILAALTDTRDALVDRAQ